MHRWDPARLPSQSPATLAMPSPRLVKAAHEFEAMMMKELMAPLTPGRGLLEQEDDSGSSSALRDFAAEAMGKAISDNGGFGLARAIVQKVSHSPQRQHGATGNQSGIVSVTRSTISNTVGKSRND